MKPYYPRGNEYFETTSKRVFYEVVYFKHKECYRTRAYFKKLIDAEKVIEKLIKSGVDFDVLIEWNLKPEYKDLSELCVNIQDYNDAQKIIKRGDS